MNCYEILGVKETDSINTITKKYRELALKYHPDRNNNKQIYTEKFKEINKAYNNIKKNHCKPNLNFDKDTFNFKNFTERLINKGEIINTLLKKPRILTFQNFLNFFLIISKK